jgi:hypothetical protein
LIPFSTFWAKWRRVASKYRNIPLITAVVRLREVVRNKVTASASFGRTESKEGKEAVMKRIRLLVLLSALAIALPIGVLSGIAKAGSTGNSSEIVINENAQYDVLGNVVHVGLRARCPVGLPGTIEVHLTQDPPETTMHAEGTSLVKQVVCDGQNHTVGATIFGANFDAGRAYATAVFLTGGTDADARWIKIIVMPG